MTLDEAMCVIDIIQTKTNKIEMVNPILEMVDKEKAEEAPKKARTFRPKKCESCGREFIPHSGVQKICDQCKEIRDTAAELAGMEGEDD